RLSDGLAGLARRLGWPCHFMTAGGGVARVTLFSRSILGGAGAGAYRVPPRARRGGYKGAGDTLGSTGAARGQHGGQHGGSTLPSAVVRHPLSYQPLTLGLAAVLGVHPHDHVRSVTASATPTMIDRVLPSSGLLKGFPSGEG